MLAKKKSLQLRRAKKLEFKTRKILPNGRHGKNEEKATSVPHTKVNCIEKSMSDIVSTTQFFLPTKPKKLFVFTAAIMKIENYIQTTPLDNTKT